MLHLLLDIPENLLENLSNLSYDKRRKVNYRQRSIGRIFVQVCLKSNTFYCRNSCHQTSNKRVWSKQIFCLFLTTRKGFDSSQWWSHRNRSEKFWKAALSPCANFDIRCEFLQTCKHECVKEQPFTGSVLLLCLKSAHTLTSADLGSNLTRGQRNKLKDPLSWRAGKCLLVDVQSWVTTL